MDVDLESNDTNDDTRCKESESDKQPDDTPHCRAVKSARQHIRKEYRDAYLVRGNIHRSQQKMMRQSHLLFVIWYRL